MSEFFLRLYRRVRADEITTTASSVAFFAMLASFPMLGAAATLFAVFWDPQRLGAVARTLASVLPGEVATVLTTGITCATDAAANGNRSSGALLTQWMPWILVLVWSANRGTKGIVTALNRVYDRVDERGFLWFHVITLLLTGCAVVLMVFTVSAILIAPALLASLSIPEPSVRMVTLLRWPVLLVCSVAGLSALYRFGPHRREGLWRWTLVGSAAGALLWVAFSVALSFYLQRVSSMTRIYGSLSAVVAFMLWLWLSALAALIGAEIEAALVLDRSDRISNSRAPPRCT